MEALELLNQHLDVEKILNHYDFDKVKGEGVFLRSCCKIHGGHNSTGFVINQDTGLWYCHTGACGGGDIYTLSQKLEGISFTQSVHRVAEILGIDINNMVITERKESHIRELKQFLVTMRARKGVPKRVPYQIEEPIRQVAKFRSFHETTLERFGLGYVESVELINSAGKPYTLKNRLVFPIIQDGVQIGISFRRINPKDVPKWSHQPKAIETNSILYNYDNAKFSPIIVVVEGLPDVWAYHEIGVPAVATFGAHLTDEQYRLLLRTGADIVLSYDGDKAGQEATNKAISLLKYKVNLEYVNFAEGEDPENITREELKQRYEGRRKV